MSGHRQNPRRQKPNRSAPQTTAIAKIPLYATVPAKENIPEWYDTYSKHGFELVDTPPTTEIALQTPRGRAGLLAYWRYVGRQIKAEGVKRFGWNDAVQEVFTTVDVDGTDYVMISISDEKREVPTGISSRLPVLGPAPTVLPLLPYAQKAYGAVNNQLTPEMLYTVSVLAGTLEDVERLRQAMEDSMRDEPEKRRCKEFILPFTMASMPFGMMFGVGSVASFVLRFLAYSAARRLSKSAGPKLVHQKDSRSDNTARSVFCLEDASSDSSADEEEDSESEQVARTRRLL